MQPGQQELGHPTEIVPTCPLIKQSLQTLDAPIFTDEERTYLNSLTPDQKEAISSALLKLSTDILAAGPEKQKTLKLLCDPQLMAPLLGVLNKLTDPLTESGNYYRACSEFIEELALLIQRLATAKQMDLAGATTSAEAPEAEIRQQAIAALREARDQLGPIPDQDDHLGINRYGLACVLLVMQIYDRGQIVQKGILDKGTSISTHYAPIDQAINKLAKLIGMRPYRIKIALGMITSRPSTIQDCQVQAATTIYTIISGA